MKLVVQSQLRHDGIFRIMASATLFLAMLAFLSMVLRSIHIFPIFGEVLTLGAISIVFNTTITLLFGWASCRVLPRFGKDWIVVDPHYLEVTYDGVTQRFDWEEVRTIYIHSETSFFRRRSPQYWLNVQVNHRSAVKMPLRRLAVTPEVLLRTVAAVAPDSVTVPTRGIQPYNAVWAPNRP